MKKSIYCIFIGIISLTMYSCGKKKSTDLPLDKDHKAAIYVTTDNNNLLSYNPLTGVKQWEIILKGISTGVPVIYKNVLYLTTNSGYLYSVDVITGKITMEKYIQKNILTSMAVANDRLYACTTDSFYCYKLNGDVDWIYRHDNPGIACTSSPQLFNGNVYFAAGDSIHAISASNGAPIWTWGASGANISSSPRVSNGVVYFGAGNKNIYALNATTGALKWNYSSSNKITSSPLVYGGMCIIGSTDFSIYCVDTTSPTAPPAGELRWKFSTGDKVSSSASVHELSNTILIGGYDFNLYAIDHVSGTLKWKYPAGSIIRSSPLVYGDYAYFTCLDRYLYCIDIRNGATVWKSFLNGTTESSPMADDLADGVYPGISGMSKY